MRCIGPCACPVPRWKTGIGRALRLPLGITRKEELANSKRCYARKLPISTQGSSEPIQLYRTISSCPLILNFEVTITGWVYSIISLEYSTGKIKLIIYVIPGLNIPWIVLSYIGTGQIKLE